VSLRVVTVSEFSYVPERRPSAVHPLTGYQMYTS